MKGFDKATRNLYDVASVAVVKGLSHLPIIVDPSHATGRPDLIPPCALAGVAVGADGVHIEVHDCPEQAKSDGPQALLPKQYAEVAARSEARGDVREDDLGVPEKTIDSEPHLQKYRRPESNRVRAGLMRRKFIAGNWKMNTTRAEGVALAAAVGARRRRIVGRGGRRLPAERVPGRGRRGDRRLGRRPGRSELLPRGQGGVHGRSQPGRCCSTSAAST